MNCPYCNEELENGYIKSSHSVYWGPNRKLGLVGNDFVLAKPSLKGIFEGLFTEAHCCKKCKKIIISFDETHFSNTR